MTKDTNTTLFAMKMAENFSQKEPCSSSSHKLYNSVLYTVQYTAHSHRKTKKRKTFEHSFSEANWHEGQLLVMSFELL